MLSYIISLCGAISTLELMNRRTSSKGLYNHLLLIGAAISLGGVSIWCMVCFFLLLFLSSFFLSFFLAFHVSSFSRFLVFHAVSVPSIKTFIQNMELPRGTNPPFGRGLIALHRQPRHNPAPRRGLSASSLRCRNNCRLLLRAHCRFIIRLFYHSQHDAHNLVAHPFVRRLVGGRNMRYALPRFGRYSQLQVQL